MLPWSLGVSRLKTLIQCNRTIICWYCYTTLIVSNPNHRVCHQDVNIMYANVICHILKTST